MYSDEMPANIFMLIIVNVHAHGRVRVHSDIFVSVWFQYNSPWLQLLRNKLVTFSRIYL